MIFFHGYDFPAPNLLNHYKGVGYHYIMVTLAVTSSTMDEWKAKSIMEPAGGTELRTPILVMSYLNRLIISPWITYLHR